MKLALAAQNALLLDVNACLKVVPSCHLATHPHILRSQDLPLKTRQRVKPNWRRHRRIRFMLNYFMFS
jgi:hypothetical protein